jgi:protein-tyrosine phosphatase
VPRTLRWDACVNVRDLGGMPTRSGRPVRAGQLIRADTLCRLTPEGQRALADHGIATVIDLQGPGEQSTPHPYVGSDAVEGRPRYLNLRPRAGRDAAGDAAFQAARGHDEIYRVSLDVNQPGLGAICRAIAEAPAGGVVVHCRAGKDRTGIVVALLLALVGAPDDAIVEDYTLSYPTLIEEYERELDDQGVRDPAEREAYHRARRSDPETMVAMLAHLRERHGGAEAYLRGAGLTAAEIAALRERLLG